MSIFVVWEKPRRDIIHFVYRPGWSYEDFEGARRKAQQMLDQVAQSVDLIIDQQAIRFNQGDFLLHAELLSHVTQHPNIRQVIVLGVPEGLVPLRRVVMSDQGLFRNYHFASSMNEAYDLLVTTSV